MCCLPDQNLPPASVWGMVKLFIVKLSPTKEVSYALSNGKGADSSMKVIESIINSALPDESKVYSAANFQRHVRFIYCTRIETVLLYVRGRIFQIQCHLRYKLQYGKIKLIAKFISDDILVRKQVGMKCFITGKMSCLMWTSILKAALKMVGKRW